MELGGLAAGAAEGEAEAECALGAPQLHLARWGRDRGEIVVR